MTERAVNAYRKACQKGTEGAILWAYRLLWKELQNPDAYPALHQGYRDWTSYPVPHRLDQIVVIGSQRILPWTIVLCKEPPWPPEMPSHAIPVSVVELAYLELAPKALWPRLSEEVARQWEKHHLPPQVNEAIGWFQSGDWEVVEIKVGTETVWQTSKPSIGTKSRGMPIKRKTVPKVEPGVIIPDE